MKSPETAIRAIRFDADEKARKVADLEQMIREFEVMASDLQRQIQAEEDRTGIRDASHFAYSTFARSAAQRRDNLMASAKGLKDKLESAVRERDEAFEQVSKHDAAETRSATTRPRNRADRHPGPVIR
ncbi:MAG: flagellar export protein FliJ [Hyphomicrobiaceae bacterium]